MPFDIALTGLSAAQNDLEVISNNIANSETAGFKKSRANFADIYASSEFGVSSNSIGQGVQVTGIQQQFTDGDITFTDNALDLAINGQGFFIMEDDGERFYGRAGAFGIDVDGNIQDPIGNQLIGFQPDSNGVITGALGPIIVNRADLAPRITSEIELGANLSATESILPAFTVAAGGPDPATYNHSTSLTTYDSLGGEHLTSLYFRRDTATNWEVFAFVDGTQVDGPDLLNFDASGNLVGVNGGAGTTVTSAAFTPGGVGTATTYTIDYAEVTQFGSPFGVSSLNQNGFETGVDDCAIVDNCPNDNTLSTANIGCCAAPNVTSQFIESITNGTRTIETNNFPSHQYCFNANNPNGRPEPRAYTFQMPTNPQIAESSTAVIRDNGRPRRYYGVALNGVLLAPAPATPFIFESPNTGEFNWDWVFEPTNTQGEGRDRVALDCASGHTGPQGYHYHGNMFQYLEEEQPGISTTLNPPSQPFHIGWAADGFPILYRFGPDGMGGLKRMLPSFRLKPGDM